MEVTLSGMSIDVKLEQSQNALEPMEVTPSGMSIDVKLEQPENVSEPMEVTLFVMLTDFMVIVFFKSLNWSLFKKLPILI